VFAYVCYLGFGQVFSIEGGAFGLREEGVAVFALVSLVVCGFVFSSFDDVFVFLF